MRLKQERIRVLKHIQDMINDHKCMDSLIIPNLDRVMEMIEKNIFRPLPNIKRVDLDKSETGVEKEEVRDPTWPYLKGVFEIYMMILMSDRIDVATLKSYCNSKFIQEFIGLFESEDPDEREFLKTILYNFY